MTRYGGRQRFGTFLIAVVTLLALASRASATQYFGPDRRGEIQARLGTQNTFQHEDLSGIDWVQWRNELRFDLKYELIPRNDTSGIFRTANFNLLYRARVDPVFAIREQYRDRNYDRYDFLFPEGDRPRELFMDIAFNGALSPLSLRIGKQQVVWGEADLFRSIDVVNPLDITQSGFVGEDFADLRTPLWIAKGLWDIGQLGPIGEAGLEFFYSPNSRPQIDRGQILFGETYRLHVNQHNVLTGFERNLTLPFESVRHPWEIGRVG
ncbi:MAG: hypothetical protein QOD06_3306, partial [Candidatus Binatota bacterium]|nr:hypothetical protein [Candidatus Binatota bacterium]